MVLLPSHALKTVQDDAPVAWAFLGMAEHTILGPKLMYTGPDGSLTTLHCEVRNANLDHSHSLTTQ